MMGLFDGFKKKKLPFHFRIYISGESQHVRNIIQCIYAVLDEKIPGLYHVTVVNVLLDPDLARGDGVISTPTLVMIKPLPLRKIFGQLYVPASLRKELAFLDELKATVNIPGKNQKDINKSG